MSLGSRRPPGLIIAAPGSGSGKTAVTLGLLAALRQRGVSVQPFKVGPDYLDTSHHERAAGRPSYNLDTWAMSGSLITSIVAHAAAGADLAIVEGVMGLFDGGPDRGLSGSGSTADLAALLGWPVVLVLDVSGQTETAAALALGCVRYRSDVQVAGVILNRVASPRHEALIRPAFDRIGLKVFGVLNRGEDMRLPERHLGLVQAEEQADYTARIERIAQGLSTSIDLDGLLAAAWEAKEPAPGVEPVVSAVAPPGQRIALACDTAFSFTYHHVIAGWRAARAEILPFSPLSDEAPPRDADAVWLPGGYPELHAGRIAAASTFMAGLRAMAVRGVPIHGECGGYMVLGRGLEDADGHRHAMAGLLPAETSFRDRRLHLGYRRAVLQADCALGRKGTRLYGHEFHYASLISDAGEPLLAPDEGASAMTSAGSRAGSVTGSFFHVLSVSRA